MTKTNVIIATRRIDIRHGLKSHIHYRRINMTCMAANMEMKSAPSGLLWAVNNEVTAAHACTAHFLLAHQHQLLGWCYGPALILRLKIIKPVSDLISIDKTKKIKIKQSSTSARNRSQQ